MADKYLADLVGSHKCFTRQIEVNHLLFPFNIVLTGALTALQPSFASSKTYTNPVTVVQLLFVSGKGSTHLVDVWRPWFVCKVLKVHSCSLCTRIRNDHQ